MASKGRVAMRKFASAYARMELSIEDHLRHTTDDDLERIESASVAQTETNCWWAEYQVAPIVRKLIKIERYRRSHGALAAGNTAEPREP